MSLAARPIESGASGTLIWNADVFVTFRIETLRIGHGTLEIERTWRRYVKPALLAMLVVASVVSLQMLLSEISTRTIVRTFLAVFPIIALIVGLERVVLRLGAGLKSMTASTARAGVYSVSLTGLLSVVASPFGW